MKIHGTPRSHRCLSSTASLVGFWLLLVSFTLFSFPTTTLAYSPLLPPPPPRGILVDRRTAALTSLTIVITTPATAAWANDSSSSSKPNTNTEFQNVGRQAPPPTGKAPFVTLSNGVQIKDYRMGSDNNGAVVQVGSKVALQITGRLLNLNGIVFYDSKKNDPDGLGGLPVTFTVGDGTALPGLETGILGMKKGGIRRIIVPPELGYARKGGGPILQPIPVNAVDQRALDSVLQNPRRDATLLFDVKLERLK